MAQVILTEDAKQRPPIVRNMTVGLSVDRAADLPRVGRQLAQLIAAIDNDHGAFDVTLDINVGGYVKPLKPGGMTVNHYHDDDNTEEYEGVD